MSINVVVDLRSQFGPIRNQHQRPTCMAFAASDCHAFARGSLDALSAEYAYYHAVNRQANADRTEGVSYRAMTETLADDGQPLESGWPYIASLQPADTWAPPATPGDIYRRVTNAIAATLDAVIDALDTGSAVLLGMRISEGFIFLDAGEALAPLASEPAAGTHAVMAVGYGELNSERYLLIRNSWGEAWADDGYGWIHQDYLASRLLIAGVMK